MLGRPEIGELELGELSPQSVAHGSINGWCDRACNSTFKQIR